MGNASNTVPESRTLGSRPQNAEYFLGPAKRSTAPLSARIVAASECGSYDGTQASVHSWGVAPTAKNSDTHGLSLRENF